MVSTGSDSDRVSIVASVEVRKALAGRDRSAFGPNSPLFKSIKGLKFERQGKKPGS
jgi:hypothetical protein